MFKRLHYQCLSRPPLLYLRACVVKSHNLSDRASSEISPVPLLSKMHALYLLFTFAWVVNFSSSMPITSDECGTRKVCFSQPSNCNPVTDTNCYFMSATPMPDALGIMFEIYGRADGYISFGFSDDQIMGNDDIYICGINSTGAVQVQRAMSTGRSRPTILLLGNVSDIAVSNADGVIACSFTSQNPISVTGTSSLDSMYYLLYAYGSSNNGGIQFHGANRFVSEARVNILNPEIIVTGQLHPFIKAHGSLMLIAWMMIGSIGMIFARYLKSVVNGNGCCQKDNWFLAHVSLMLLTIAMTITAFVLVFVHVRGWSGGVHPVLGCLVMGLSLIQPVAAAFRCAPDHHWRYIFNWLHGLNALVIKILAVAAIFTGLSLIDNSQDRWRIKVMGGFVGWEALFYLLLDAHMWWKKKDEDDCISNLKHAEVILLFLFLLGNLAFILALLTGIGML